jgi:hypothetical protein
VDLIVAIVEAVEISAFPVGGQAHHRPYAVAARDRCRHHARIDVSTGDLDGIILAYQLSTHTYHL